MIKSKVLLTIFSNKLLSNFATKRKKTYSSSDIAYSIQDALKFVRCHSISAFDETIDISLMLNIYKLLISFSPNKFKILYYNLKNININKYIYLV